MLNNEEYFEPNPNPYENASIFSKATFWWIWGIISLGANSIFQLKDLHVPPEDHQSKFLSDKFSYLWNHEKIKFKPKLFRVIFTVFGWKVLIFSIFYTIIDIFARTIQPQFLGVFISYFEKDQTNMTMPVAWYYGAGIILCSLIPMYIFHLFLFYAFRISMKIRLVSTSLIYNKILKLNTSILDSDINDKIDYLIKNDLPKLDLSIGYCNNLWKGPIELFIFSYFIYREIHCYGLIGIGIFGLYLLLRYWMNILGKGCQKALAAMVKPKLSLITEIVEGIKLIKMYTWEFFFIDKVQKFRRKECYSIEGYLYMSDNLAPSIIIQVLAIGCSLLGYVYTQNILTARKIFIVIIYFQFLYTSLLHYWPMAMKYLTEFCISINRIEEFLLLPENKYENCENNDTEESGLIHNNLNNSEIGLFTLRRTVNTKVETGLIQFEAVSAEWITKSGDKHIGINSIDLEISSNQLFAITGASRSGKSTLLKVLLGELEIDSGYLKLNGKISYAASEVWLFPGTVRKNITFTEKYDGERYDHVINACKLNSDFETFRNGDEMIINGMNCKNLTECQMVRIHLARCIYQKAEIYLFDNLLSKVSETIGKHIFENCFENLLKNNICLLVTNQLEYMKYCNKILIMENGEIVCQGKFDEIKESEYYNILQNHNIQSSIITTRNEQILINSKLPDDLRNEPNFEEINCSPFSAYCQIIANRKILVFIGVTFIAAQIAISEMNFFLASAVNWEQTKQNDNNLFNKNQTFSFMESYIIRIVIVFLIAVLRSSFFLNVCTNCGTKLHNMLAITYIRAKLHYFDIIPLCRILSRFSNDFHAINVEFPLVLMDSIAFLLEYISITIIISMINYWSFIPAFFLGMVFCALRSLYVKMARSLKHLEIGTRTSIYNHIKNILNGLSTVRVTHDAEKIVSDEFHYLQDLNTSTWFLSLGLARGVLLSLEFISVIHMAVSILLLICFHNYPGYVGLVITQCLYLVFILQWGMVRTIELISQMEYFENVRNNIKLNKEPAIKSLNKHLPPKEWPANGAIKFSRVSIRSTSESLQNNLNITINAREKVTVFGDHPSKEWDFIQALYRFITFDGAIEIDQFNINIIGLHDLRCYMSIIPQEPILFSGMLRFNLDPLKQKTDEEIFDALEKVELKTMCENLPNGLDYQITYGSDDFTFEQKLLICLTKAILEKNQIIIYHETPKHINKNTENIIQNTLNTAFTDCTVIGIGKGSLRCSGRSINLDDLTSF